MNLKEFLETARVEEAPVLPVKFKAVSIRPSDGTRMWTEVSAVLVFVNDSERSEAVREADKYLREKYTSRNAQGQVIERLPVPDDARVQEEMYQVLHRALRDVDDHGQ